MIPAPIRILGIDPGLRNTGWGMIEVLGTRLSFVACGTVHSDGDLHLADRLRQLHEGLTEVVHAQMPHEVAVEEGATHVRIGSALWQEDVLVPPQG